MGDLREEVKKDDRLKIDLWVCNHFKVLPTEQRFKDLTDDQKLLLFIGYLENPSSEEIRLNYLSQEKKKEDIPVLNDNELEALEGSGFTKEQLERIQNNLSSLKDG